MTGQGSQRLLAGLVVASRLWATRQPLDAERVSAARAAILIANHERYVQDIPAYRRLAQDLGALTVDDLDELVAQLLIGVSLFKSYDPRLLQEGRFAELTGWIAQVSTLRPEPDLEGVRDLEGWRTALRRCGVYVSVSSGTTGRPSLVPRDAATLGALRSNGRWYSTLGLDGGAEFECLVLVPPGTALGIQAVATGVAQAAARAHRLGEGLEEGWEATGSAVALAERAAASSRGSGRPLIVFGTPLTVSRLCTALLESGSPLRLPATSLLVTGGGWKGAGGDETPADFGELVAAALGLDAPRTVDVYGLSECNAFLVRCAHGRYHVPPVLEAVVVDERLQPLAGDDVTGEIGLLDPFAFSYPGFLLTGDVGRLVRTPCLCGLIGPGFVGAIDRAQGRDAKGCAGALAGALA